MKLSEFKKALNTIDEIHFELPNGTLVPSHFHITEVGRVSKHFIDCGEKLRKENLINFQLWEADDYNHRLHPKVLLKIISLAQNSFDLEDLNIEVEYQRETIGKYGLTFNGKTFLLVNKLTECLDPKKCGIPASKPKIRIPIGISKK